MSKPEKHQLNHVSDFSALSVEQFKRMLPDFIGWFAFAKEMQEVGARTTGFMWVDDGEVGVISEVHLTVDGADKTEIFNMREEAP